MRGHGGAAEAGDGCLPGTCTLPRSSRYPLASAAKAGFQPIRQRAVPIVNMSYTENSFSTLVAKMIAGYVVGREAVTSEEANDWLAEFCGARRERRVLLLSNSNYHTEAIKVS